MQEITDLYVADDKNKLNFNNVETLSVGEYSLYNSDSYTTLDKDSYIVDEALTLRSDLASISVDCSVNEAEYKVDALKVIKLAKKVEEPRTLVPNYLRDTEAERNLNA